jgi:hypothetical protein
MSESVAASSGEEVMAWRENVAFSLAACRRHPAAMAWRESQLALEEKVITG